MYAIEIGEMVTSRQLWLMLLTLSCSVLILQVGAQNYEIVHERTESNTVTLSCRQTGGAPFPSTSAAHFWVNNTMDEHLQHVAAVGSPSYLFLITREFEGQYFCGPNKNEISQKEDMIYRPEFNVTLLHLPTRVVRVQAGDTAVIPPYIGPGVWYSRYHIDWTDANESTVGRIDGLRHPLTFFSPPERYSVDIGSFSLRIQNVRRLDAGTFVGKLGVMEESTSHSYDKPLKPVKLLVYEPPVITGPPEKQVIAYREGVNISFSCTAKGFPRPEITWTHNDEPITSRFIQTDVSTGDDTIQSMLTITEIAADDSGHMKCIATVTPGGEVEPIVNETAVPFSILKINKAVAKQTIDGGLTFIVYMAKELPEDVYIHLAFAGDLQDITSEYSFHSGKKLAVFLDHPPFPVNHFTVDVTVLLGNTHSVPFQIESNQLLRDCDQKVVIFVVPIGLGLLVICPCVCVLLVYCISKVHHYKFIKMLLKNAKTKDDKNAILGCALKTFCDDNIHLPDDKPEEERERRKESSPRPVLNGQYSHLSNNVTPVHGPSNEPSMRAGNGVVSDDEHSGGDKVIEVIECRHQVELNGAIPVESEMTRLSEGSTVIEMSQTEAPTVVTDSSKIKSKGSSANSGKKKKSSKHSNSCRTESIKIGAMVMDLMREQNTSNRLHITSM